MQLEPDPYEGTGLFRLTGMSDETTDNAREELPEGTESSESLDITEIVSNSPVLARLIEEVRSEHVVVGHAYDRMHNRHNRSR